MIFLKKAKEAIGIGLKFNKVMKQHLKVVQNNNGNGIDEEAQTALDNTVITNHRVKALEDKIRNSEFKTVEQLQ